MFRLFDSGISKNKSFDMQGNGVLIMKRKLKPIVAGLCLGGLLLSGCGKEEEKDKTTTDAGESTDIVTTEE